MGQLAPHGDGWTGDSLAIGYGKFKIGATGTVVVFLLALALVITANLWGAEIIQRELTEASRAAQSERTSNQAFIIAEFKMLRLAQNRTTCILTMNEKERSAFRQSRDPYHRWCAWVED